MFGIRSLLSGAVMLVASGLAANAAVLNFDAAAGAPGAPYIESGFQITDPSGYLAADAGSLHFDIAGGPYGASRSLTSVSGSAFSVASLDIISLWNDLSVFTGGPQPDISFVGYLGGSAVAWAWGSSQIGNNTFSFGSAFGKIDQFTITGNWTGNFDWAALGMPDVHFLIDNIDVSPVPLPASAVLLALAIGGLVVVRRRGRGAASA